MKRVLVVSGYALLLLSVMLQGCNKEECLCEPVALTEEFKIPESDSLWLDSLFTDLMGPKPILGADSIVRYLRVGVWDTTRTVTVIRKSSSGYLMDRFLYKKIASETDGAISSESRPFSHLEWQTIINSINTNCFFTQPFQHTNTSVLDASPISMDVYFPGYECGEDYHMIIRPYLKEDDPIRHISKALYDAGINRPFGTHQIDPIVD